MADYVEAILTQLNDEDIDVRWQAVREAQCAHDRRVIGPLVERLADREPEVRAQAAEALRYLRDDRIVPGLLPLLTDDNAEVRVAACRGLGARYAREALDPLLHCLRDAEAEVRGAAANALRAYPSRRVTRALQQALHDQEPQVRRRAVETLCGLGDMDTVLTVLHVAQSDPDRGVRLEAVEGLRYLVPAYEATVWNGLEADDDLVGQLLRMMNDVDDEVAAGAIETLAEVGGARAVHPLLALACDWDAEYGKRLAAIVALGGLDDFRVTPILIATLSDPERSLRPWAAYALGRLCDPRALPELDRCEQADSVKLRNQAREAACLIRYELSWSDFDQLLVYLKSKDDNEQLRAIACLGRSRDARAGEVLLKILRESRGKQTLFHHVEAIKAVANAGLEEALPLLADTAEFWGKAGSPGLMKEAEDAANYIRRKLNGERLTRYVPSCECEGAKVLDD